MKYYGNKATKVVHTNSRNDRCRKSQIKKGNKVNFQSAQEAWDKGYRSCGHCFGGE